MHEAMVVGVMDNIHRRSLAFELHPTILIYRENVGRFASLNTTPIDLPQTRETIEAKFHEIFPDRPFEYFFLDEHFAEQYQADQRSKKYSAFSPLWRL